MPACLRSAAAADPQDLQAFQRRRPRPLPHLFLFSSPAVPRAGPVARLDDCAIALARQGHAFDLWAWVIMPEHVHLLLFPRNRQYKISAILTTLKQSVSKRA